MGGDDEVLTPAYLFLPAARRTIVTKALPSRKTINSAFIEGSGTTWTSAVVSENAGFGKVPLNESGPPLATNDDLIADVVHPKLQVSQVERRARRAREYIDGIGRGREQGLNQAVGARGACPIAHHVTIENKEKK